ncbi:MAG: hypothetical protein ACLSFT_08950 [Ruminococcus callidus]
MPRRTPFSKMPQIGFGVRNVWNPRHTAAMEQPMPWDLHQQRGSSSQSETV